MRIAHALLLVAALVSVANADGPGAPAAPAAPKAPVVPVVPGEIAWHASVADAVAAGKAEGKPIFVAINASKVDGGKAEPAGRELRDRTYKDPAVVEKSRAFACVIVYADATGADFDELRARFSVGMVMVSPQHIFAYSDGTTYERREYWPHAAGQASVDALLEMMNRALAAQAAHVGLPPPGAPATPPAAPATPGTEEPAMGEPGMGDAPAAPAEDARKTWIDQTIAKIKATADPAARAALARDFLAQDQKGDCVQALCVLALESKKENDLRALIARLLGRPGLEAAVPTLLDLIEDKDDSVRSNAIVSLEYVGSATACDALTKRLPREKVDLVYSNTCRALGHCGRKLEAVRKTLVRELKAAKGDVQFAGAAIGLAHFEKDADAARALEAEIKKVGPGTKRGFALWALTEIMDPKSAEFVKKEVLANEKNQWILPWVSAVYNVLSGNGGPESKQTVDGGMSYVVGTVPGGIADLARRDRAEAGYTPKGEFEGRGRGPGGPGGGGPGGGPGGMGGGMGG